MARPKNCNKCGKPKRPRGNSFKGQPGYCECGRPPVIDKTVLQKLEDAFSNGCTDLEACIYAGIAERTLYNYQIKNPEFVHRKEALKMTPNIGARAAIAEALRSKDLATAKWWLERKDPTLKPTSKVEHGGHIEVSDTAEADLSDDEKNAIEALRVARRKRIEQQARDKAKK